jgi:hypothetical protein
VEPGELVATSEPTITGEPVVDSRLTASPGTWTPEPGTLSYQWSAAGNPVAGATEQTFVPGPAQVGKALRVEVTATKSGYTDVRSVSAATAPVSPGTLTATASPVLTGTARLGETLSLDPGAVTPTGAKAGIEWLRSGVPVPGATGSTYVLTADDLGARMRARVTHAKDGYTPLEATTSATRLVKSVSTMTVTTSTPRPGRLRVDLGVVAGGVDPVEGVVRVRAADGSLLGELTLTEGAARTVIRGLEPGRQRFRFRFLPTPTVTTDLLARTVRIR